jgi:putative lipoprotein
VQRALRAVLAATALAATASTAGAAGEIWRGNFIAGKPGLMMSPCRSGERLQVEDRTPARELEVLYKELAQRPGRAIFVEIAGKRDGKSLVAERVHRAYAEGPGCREDLQDVRLRAMGNEPFWSFESRAGGAALRLLPQPAMAFPAGGFERRGEEYVYEGASERSVVRIAVREGPCRDTMSGAYFTLGAQVEVDGRKYSGCAYWGDAGPR